MKLIESSGRATSNSVVRLMVQAIVLQAMVAGRCLPAIRLGHLASTAACIACNFSSAPSIMCVA